MWYGFWLLLVVVASLRGGVVVVVLVVFCGLGLLLADMLCDCGV